jgi:hypothetical protein
MFQVHDEQKSQTTNRVVLFDLKNDSDALQQRNVN